MPEQIAVGIDGSAASRAALEWAVRRADSDARSLVLLHVAGNTAYAATPSDSIAQAQLEFARSLSPEVAVTFEIHHGTPVKVLAEEAHRFDLLAVGTHKTGFLRGRAFGSTSLRLAAIVDVPLAVIPVSFGGKRQGIIVGIDDESSAMSTLRIAAHEALRRNSPLTLIHARADDGNSPIPGALTLLREEYPTVSVRARELPGIGGEVLTTAALNAELLFIGGPTAHSGLGEVGYDVLLNISGPTILVPADRGAANLVTS